MPLPIHRRHAAILYALFLLPGCYLRQAYYVSPFNGNTGDYHTQPLLADSSRSAVYVSGNYYTGTANDDKTDSYKAGNIEVYRSHRGHMVQGYYGLNMSVGSYHTGKWDSAISTSAARRDGPPLNWRQLNTFQGDRTFGGVGFDGGVNMVMPVKGYEHGGGEWRYLGLETSFRREFGQYLSFRKTIPDTAATLIVKSNFYATLGLTTEIVGKVSDGELGFKIATGWVLGGDYNYLGIRDNAGKSPLRFHYTSFTFHYSWQRYTAITQANFATKSMAFHLGICYRFSTPRFRTF